MCQVPLVAGLLTLRWQSALARRALALCRLPTGLTALHLAAFKGSLPLVKAILRAYVSSLCVCVCAFVLDLHLFGHLVKAILRAYVRHVCRARCASASLIPSPPPTAQALRWWHRRHTLCPRAVRGVGGPAALADGAAGDGRAAAAPALAPRPAPAAHAHGAAALPLCAPAGPPPHARVARPLHPAHVPVRRHRGRPRRRRRRRRVCRGRA